MPDVHAWLREGLEAPKPLLDRALRGLSGGSGVGAASTLQQLGQAADWAGPDATALLDVALVAWIDEHWGSWQPSEACSTATVADGWTNAAALATFVAGAHAARGAFRQRVPDLWEYLGPLATGPAQDPVGRVLQAAAREQPDWSLAPIWWRMLRFPEDVPLHHLRIGLEGIRGLPPAESDDDGMFPEEVAHGLEVAVGGLLAAAHDGRISVEMGRAQTVRLARWGLIGYPKREWWQAAIDFSSLPGPAGGWLLEAFGVEAAAPSEGVAVAADTMSGSASKAPSGSHQSVEYVSFVKRVADARRQLQERGRAAYPVADAVIADQRRQAERSGDSTPFVKTLCNLGTVLRRRDPQKAAEWAREALEWEPWDEYAWSLRIRAEWNAHDPESALGFAFDAVDRVPFSASLRIELGETLRAAKLLWLAEEVFRQQIELFGDDHSLALSALGSVLLSAGRFFEAQQTFERVLAIEPSSSHGLHGLSRAFREQKQPERAVQLLTPKLELFREEVYVWHEYIMGLEEMGRTADAASVRASAEKRFRFDTPPAFPVPDVRISVDVPDASARLGQARLLRQLVARPTFRPLHSTFLNDADRLLQGRTAHREIAEQGLVLRARGKFGEASSLIRQTLERAPGIVRLHHTLGAIGVAEACVDRTYSPERLRSLTAPYASISRVRPTLDGVADVGAARAALALRDGPPCDEDAMAALIPLSSPAGEPEPRGWLRSRVRSVLLAADQMPNQGLLALARERADSQFTVLEQLEDAAVTVASMASA